MSRRSFASPFNGRASKADRLNARTERQERKAERRAVREAEHAARIAAGIRGPEIDWAATHD
jgi:hypothetical protein